MVKYAYIIGKLNYFEWIKFLESVNDKDLAYNIAGCLDDSSQRVDLSKYRTFLFNDLHEHTCFYCGAELNGTCEVDHFIPWSFVIKCGILYSLAKNAMAASVTNLRFPFI